MEKNAVYRLLKYERYLVVPLTGLRINLGYKKVYFCDQAPTAGTDGQDGDMGIRGIEGRRGGDSGSFHIQSFNVSGFHLNKVKNTPGKGFSWRNGQYRRTRRKDLGEMARDPRGICKVRLRTPKAGRNGKRGHFGYQGKDGVKGTACIESFQNYETENPVNKYRNIICY